jgi:hypothetical protein
MTDIFESLHDPSPPLAGRDRLAIVKRRSRDRRRRRLIVIAGAAAVIVMSAGAGTMLIGSGGGESSVCAGGIWFDGRSYLHEDFNDGVFDADELGEVIGTVTRTRPCPERDGDASELPVGTELRAAPHVNQAVGFAAVVDGEVEFFRTFHSPADRAPADVLALHDVVEIGLNSDFDGSTRWATLTDPAQVAVVVEGISTAPIEEIRSTEWTKVRMRAFIEFVRRDGLVTRSTYLVDSHLVAIGSEGVALPSATRDVLNAALSDAPPAVPRSDIQLTGLSGTTPVFGRAACRLDRPNLRAAPDEVLQIKGAQAAGISISFVLVSGPEIEMYSIEQDALARGIALPSAPGRIIIELVPMNAGASYCAVVTITP